MRIEKSRLAVAVCAREWNPGLEECLDSLLRQETTAEFSFAGIIVVVNSASSFDLDYKSFDRWFKAARETGVDISCVNEPLPGISYARNTACKTAEKLGCDWLAFIDDDCQARAGWLENLTSTQLLTGAPIVAGDTIIKAATKPSPWVPKDFFGPAGYPNHEFIGESRKSLRVAYTRNVLFSLPVAKKTLGRELLFNESLSLTGGEDIYLFSELSSSGLEIIFDPEALVTEIYQANRVHLRWWFMRAIRNGQLRSSAGLRPGGSRRTIQTLWAHAITPLFLMTSLPIIAPYWLLRRNFRENLGRTVIRIAPAIGAIGKTLGLIRREYA